MCGDGGSGAQRAEGRLQLPLQTLFMWRWCLYGPHIIFSYQEDLKSAALKKAYSPFIPGRKHTCQACLSCRPPPLISNQGRNQKQNKHGVMSRLEFQPRFSSVGAHLNKINIVGRKKKKKKTARLLTLFFKMASSR